MAFKFSLPKINFQLPDNIRQGISDLPESIGLVGREIEEGVENIGQNIKSRLPQELFDPEELQPLLLEKIETSRMPDFLKIPAKFGIQIMTDTPQEVVKKRELWEEVKRVGTKEESAVYDSLSRSPWGFVSIPPKTLKKLPKEAQVEIRKYQDTAMLDMGMMAGSLQVKGVKVAAPLFQGIKAKLGSFFKKDIQELVEEIPQASKRLVNLETAKDIAEETLNKYIADPDNPVFKDESKRLFKQVGELLHTGDLQVDSLPEIFKKYNLNAEQFADLYMDTMSISGKQLNELSKLRKQMIAAFPDLEEKLGKITMSDPGLWGKVAGVFSKLEQTRRGLLVSQLATTARNILSQSGRYTIQFADDVLTGSAEALTGKRPPKDAFMPALQDILSVGRQFSPKARQALAQMVDSFPIQKNQLFANPTGEAHLGSKITRLANTFNTAQEYFFRKMRLDALLNTHMKTVGGAIDDKIMQGWIDDALELTFAKRPKGGFLGEFYKTFSHPFFTAVANPFPRFWANSMKFLWDFSPGGFTKLLSPKFLKELVSKDPRKAYSSLSKAVIGSGMFAGAMAIRNNEDMAGEKWYEVKMPDGKMWDTRAFAPFSTYLFLAEALKEDNKLTGYDYAQGLVSINRIAGTGLVLVDLIRANDAESLQKNLKKFGGAYLSGFTVPFRTFKDFIAQAVPEEQVYKDTDQALLLGPALENIPFATSQFPTAPRPTRDEPFIREDPIIRQLTGMTFKTKTPLEREIDRLGIEYTTLYPRTGEDDLDRMITRKVGAVMDVVGNEVVKSDKYKELGAFDQKELIKGIYSDVKSASKKITLEESAAQIAAGIYEQMKTLEPNELKEFVTRIKDRGLMTDRVLEFVLAYTKADASPEGLEDTVRTQMGGEKLPTFLGLSVP